MVSITNCSRPEPVDLHVRSLLSYVIFLFMAFTLETLIPMINVYLQSLPPFHSFLFSLSIVYSELNLWILQVRKSFCTKPIRYYTISQFLSENLPSNSRGNKSNRFRRIKFMASMACNRFSISEWLCFLWLRNMFFGLRGIFSLLPSYFTAVSKSEGNNFWLKVHVFVSFSFVLFRLKMAYKYLIKIVSLITIYIFSERVAVQFIKIKSCTV